VIVAGNVISQSPPRMVAPPAQPLQPFAPAGARAVPPDKDGQLAGHIPPLPKAEPALPSQDQPVTDYMIRVDRVLKGTLASGSTITVTQTGGTVERPTYPGGPKLSRTLMLEHDPLMAPGQQHLMFLSRTSDGRYYVVGGPQGRFSIDKGGKVHPVDPAAATPARPWKGWQRRWARWPGRSRPRL
jgi:hypothetical protein